MAKIRDLFGIDSDMEIPAFSQADERVPDLDPAYVFDPDTTLSICAGFSRNPRISLTNLRPNYNNVAINVGRGVTPVSVVLNYRFGLAIRPVA